MRFFKSVFFHLSVIFALSVCPAQAKISEVNYSKAGFPGKIAAYELNDELYLSAAQVVRVFGGKINWFGKSSKVQLSMHGKTALFFADENRYISGGKEIRFRKPLIIRGGDAYVSMAFFISEDFRKAFSISLFYNQEGNYISDVKAGSVDAVDYCTYKDKTRIVYRLSAPAEWTKREDKNKITVVLSGTVLPDNFKKVVDDGNVFDIDTYNDNEAVSSTVRLKAGHGRIDVFELKNPFRIVADVYSAGPGGEPQAASGAGSAGEKQPDAADEKDFPSVDSGTVSASGEDDDDIVSIPAMGAGGYEGGEDDGFQEDGPEVRTDTRQVVITKGAPSGVYGGADGKKKAAAELPPQTRPAQTRKESSGPAVPEAVGTEKKNGAEKQGPAVAAEAASGPVPAAVVAPAVLRIPDKVQVSGKVKKIVIDPGHGGKDPGGRKLFGLKEKEINLYTALALEKLFDKNDKFQVMLTRSDDVFIPLNGRSLKANEFGVDIFISLHANAASNRNQKGFEIYHMSETASDPGAEEVANYENSVVKFDNEAYKQDTTAMMLHSLARTEYMNEGGYLAALVAEEMSRETPFSVRGTKGVKQAAFYVLRGTYAPGILVETGFMTNYNDDKNLNDKKVLDKVAQAIYNGVLRYAELKGW